MSEFPNTIWTLIGKAATEPRDGSREHMSALLRMYWQPIYAHLRFKGIEHQKAEDLVQEFSIQLLEKDLLGVADPNKGKFRTLLLTALDRFVVSRFRHENAAKRRPAHIASLDAATFDHTEAVESPVSAAFDRAYALDVLAFALARMKKECKQSGDAVRWQVFECRVVNPTLDAAEIPEYRQIAAELNLKNEKAAMNLLVTAKRHFARVLRQNVRDYVIRSRKSDDYIAAVAAHLTASSSSQEESRRAATQITEQALAALVEEEIRSLRQILADTKSAEPIEISRSRSGEGEELLFLDRLASADSSNRHRAFEWGLDDGECSDDVIFASLVDTPMNDIGIAEAGTIRGALTSGQASVEALKGLKHWIKLQRLHDERTFARKFASTIYYATIASALVFFDVRISNLPNRQLIYGIDSVAEETWMDKAVADVLKQARAMLKSRDQNA